MKWSDRLSPASRSECCVRRPPGIVCHQPLGANTFYRLPGRGDMHWAASVVKEDGFVCRKLDLVQAGSCDLFCLYLGMLRVRYWTFDVMFHVVYHPTRCNMNTVLQKKMLDSAETKFSWALVDQKPCFGALSLRIGAMQCQRWFYSSYIGITISHCNSPYQATSTVWYGI